MFGNLLDVFVIAHRVFALLHLTSSLLNAMRMSGIALIELLEFRFRLNFGAFAVAIY